MVRDKKEQELCLGSKAKAVAAPVEHWLSALGLEYFVYLMLLKIWVVKLHNTVNITGISIILGCH